MSKPKPQRFQLMKEGTSRTRGRTAVMNNIITVGMIGDLLKTTLGPKGMDKLIVSDKGEVTITNEGSAVLKELSTDHPLAKMVMDAAKTQDKAVGDGTTTVAVFIAELLKNAGDLIEQNIHPSIIIKGYRKAADEALELLQKVSIPVNIADKQTLQNVVATALRSKMVQDLRAQLADIAVQAIDHVAEKRGDEWDIDVYQVQVTKKVGESATETRLIQGLVIDKPVVHVGMPKKVKQARILLLYAPLDLVRKKVGVSDAVIRIHDPRQMKAFLDEESGMFRDMVQKIQKLGANVVVSQKGIDNVAQYYLAKAGILAVRRVKQDDMQMMMRATGGRVVSNLDEMQPGDLGYADLVEERRLEGDKLVFVEGCKNPKSVAVFIRGGFKRILDEAERSLNDALCVLSAVYRKSRLVAGGGAVEAVIAKHLRGYAAKIGGREQLAVEAFADAVESIPRALAENAGLNPIDIIVSLRAAHGKPDGLWYGVNVLEGKVEDSLKAGVLEPLKVKEQAIKSAVEAASMILRIDDVIIAKRGPSGT